MDVDEDFVVSRRGKMESIKSNKVFNIAVIFFFLNIVIRSFAGIDTGFWQSFILAINHVLTIILLLVSFFSIGLKITEYTKSEANERSVINLAANALAIVGFVFLTVSCFGYTYLLSDWFNLSREFIEITITALFLLSAVLKLVCFLIIKKNTIEKSKCSLTSNKALTIGAFFAIFNIWSMYLNWISSVISFFLAVVFMVVSIVFMLKNIFTKDEHRFPLLKGVSLISLTISIIAINVTSTLSLFISYLLHYNIDIASIVVRIYYPMQFLSIAFFATAFIFKIIDVLKNRKAEISE